MMKTVPKLSFGSLGVVFLCLIVIGSITNSHAQIFQTATVSDAISPSKLPPGSQSHYLTYPFLVPCDLAGMFPGLDNDCPTTVTPTPAIQGSMTAEFLNIVVKPGDGTIGGDVLEFDVKITNTSTDGSILTAFAFQSKYSESPALASRIGDKLFSGISLGATPEGMTDPKNLLASVKKNGTSNGLFTGKWKGICINSSEDYLPAFNGGIENESLECAGNRIDMNADGEPEVLKGADIKGLRPGESQIIRLRLDSGVTDGALHVTNARTLTGDVKGIPLTADGIGYFDVEIDQPGTVLEVVEFADNKVLAQADGTFDPTFAPLIDNLSLENQIYLTLPRPNFAFSDLLGRNHDCETYGLDALTTAPCASDPSGQPFISLDPTAPNGVGSLVSGVDNLAAILRGYGEFIDPDGDFVPNPDMSGETRPSEPYGELCENCGGIPYVPIAEFYKPDPNDPVNSVIRQMTAGEFDPDAVANPYKITVSTDPMNPDDFLEELIPEIDPGGPTVGAQLNTSATAEFKNLKVIKGDGINGGDAIMFTMTIKNTSTNPDAYLTAFNYQTKRRGLADIGVLDGFTQDRRDVRVDNTLTFCNTLEDENCFNADLGIGQFPNVIGNGLLFGQMVWKSADAGREPDPVSPGQVFVDPIDGIDPPPHKLESVKKNGPFTPLLKGSNNFICIKSGLFDLDPDADAECAGEPAILKDPDLPPVPSNITQRLGLPPLDTQDVRIRMEFGDFRGALLRIAKGTLTKNNVSDGTDAPDYTSTDGLARSFDASDQRELEYAHPFLVGQNIGYLENTNAKWLTPEKLEDIEYVILNQPGDAPTVMKFEETFGIIMAMAGFAPTAEFYAPDPNSLLAGTPYEGVLIQQQVLGTYGITDVNASPVADFTATPNDLMVNFDASASTDPDGTIVGYNWDFGDASPAGSGVTPSHTYAVGGFYDVTLTVTDDEGAMNSTTQTIGVFDPNVNVLPSASFTASDKALKVDFDASASADVDGSIDSYSWDFGDGSPTGSGATTSHTYTMPGTYTVTLTVEDNDGATGTTSQMVTVDWDGNIISNGSNSTDIGSQTIDWTSSFTNNNYIVGDYVVVRAEWEADCGVTSFNPSGHPVGVVPRGSEFSPTGVTGTMPVVLASGDDFVVFCFQYTNIPGVKGNAQFNILVGKDEDCNNTVDGQAMLGINVHVRTDGGDL